MMITENGCALTDPPDRPVRTTTGPDRLPSGPPRGARRGHRARCRRAGLPPLDPARQLRMGVRLHEDLRDRRGRARDPAAGPEGQRDVVLDGGADERTARRLMVAAQLAAVPGPAVVADRGAGPGDERDHRRCRAPGRRRSRDRQPRPQRARQRRSGDPRAGPGGDPRARLRPEPHRPPPEPAAEPRRSR